MVSVQGVETLDFASLTVQQDPTIAAENSYT